MALPIKFPSETEVVRDEVDRRRNSSREERIQDVDEMFRFCLQLIAASGRAEKLHQMADLEERAEYDAIMEFANRHACQSIAGCCA